MNKNCAGARARTPVTRKRSIHARGSEQSVPTYGNKREKGKTPRPVYIHSYEFLLKRVYEY